MLYSEIIAVCSQIHTKHINTVCGQNVEFVNVKHGGKYSNHWALKNNVTLHMRCYAIFSNHKSLYIWYNEVRVKVSVYFVFVQGIHKRIVRFQAF
jgi:hypothetical protein